MWVYQPLSAFRKLGFTEPIGILFGNGKKFDKVDMEKEIFY